MRLLKKSIIFSADVNHSNDFRTNMADFVLKIGNPAKIIPEDLDAFIYQVGLLNSSIILST